MCRSNLLLYVPPSGTLEISLTLSNIRSIFHMEHLTHVTFSPTFHNKMLKKVKYPEGGMYNGKFEPHIKDMKVNMGFTSKPSKRNWYMGCIFAPMKGNWNTRFISAPYIWKWNMGSIFAPYIWNWNMIFIVKLYIRKWNMGFIFIP